MRAFLASLLARSNVRKGEKGGNMFKPISCAVALSMFAASSGHAAEPGSTPVPTPVAGLAGCWEGSGEVIDKAVTVSISARPIVQGAMFALDAESSALADPKDRYSAHLIFGGASKEAGAQADPVTGFWTDSFGGSFAASGRGETVPGGFDITYHYPDDSFVNRWRLTPGKLSWVIVMRDAKGVEAPFARYSLRKTACPPAETEG